MRRCGKCFDSIAATNTPHALNQVGKKIPSFKPMAMDRKESCLLDQKT